MAFTAKILSWRFRHLNIVALFAQKKAYQGGVTGTPGLPLATPLVCMHNENEMKSKLRCTISSKSLSFLVNPNHESVPLFK